jgi:hypothetical protein
MEEFVATGRIGYTRLMILALLCRCPSPSSADEVRWKAILFAGDSSAPVFDNATRDLARLLERRGIPVVATFSADRAKVSPTVQHSTHEELRRLPTWARVSAGEGCLFFATSHGTRQGLRLPQDPRAKILSPDSLDQIITDTCGEAPTVLVISACHSGTFIRASTTRPNRIIFTAAREDRKSFGCRAERRYTFYDGCVLTEFPKAATWEVLHSRVRGCIDAKEASRKDPPSEPQAFIGEGMKDVAVPRAR